MAGLIQQFVEMTGGTEQEARQLLEICNQDLESAINVFLDGGVSNVPAANPVFAGGSVSSVPPSKPHTAQSITHNASNDEEYVRPPIAPIRGRLVDEPYAYSAGVPDLPRNAFERKAEAFRDFREEAKLSAKELEKQDTLSKLFRPPLEVMFVGTFDQAREEGQLKGKWLLVNIQKTDEFPCQVLNRDIWKDESILKLVRSQFILWQMNADTVEGQRFMRFYPFDDFPYIAALDPRTGELVQKWGPVIERNEFLASLQDFKILNELTVKSQSPPRKKQKTIIDLDEDEQMRAAIALSMAESKVEQATLISLSSSENDDSQDGVHPKKIEHKNPITVDLDASDSTDDEADIKRKGKEPAPVDEPEPPADADASEVTRLQIRMEDGSRIVRRFWRHDDVQAVFNFVAFTRKRSTMDFEIMMLRDKLRDRIGQTLTEAGVINAVVNVVTPSE